MQDSIQSKASNDNDDDDDDGGDGNGNFNNDYEDDYVDDIPWITTSHINHCRCWYDDDIDCDSDDDCNNVDAGWKYASGVSISDGDIVIIVKEIDNQLYSQRLLEVLKSHC